MPWYSLDDPLDVRNTHRALGAQVRLHAAAGAHRIQALAGGLPTWRLGDDVEPMITIMALARRTAEAIAAASPAAAATTA